MSNTEKELTDLSDSGLLPMIVSKTGSTDEPIEEVIICDTISGGAQYTNGMPKRLSLTRQLKDGTEYRCTYVQTEPDK